jgi:hypothetical protein
MSRGKVEGKFDDLLFCVGEFLGRGSEWSVGGLGQKNFGIFNLMGSWRSSSLNSEEKLEVNQPVGCQSNSGCSQVSNFESL